MAAGSTARDGGPRRILVPVNGSDFDDDIVRVAAATAAPEAELSLVYVIVVKRSLSLNAELDEEAGKGEAILDRAERAAAACGVSYATELLQARATGPAIVDEAAHRKADLIVMGVSYRKRFGEFYLGQTTPYVLKNAPCRVWLVRATKPTSGD